MKNKIIITLTTLLTLITINCGITYADETPHPSRQILLWLNTDSNSNETDYNKHAEESNFAHAIILTFKNKKAADKANDEIYDDFSENLHATKIKDMSGLTSARLVTIDLSQCEDHSKTEMIHAAETLHKLSNNSIINFSKVEFIE